MSKNPSLAKMPTSSRGRPFLAGNAGRKPGSRNRSTLLRSAISETEFAAMLDIAKQVAMRGDVTMLKFLLAQYLPKERPVNLNFPRMEFADDGIEALGQIAGAVVAGDISPGEGEQLASIVRDYLAAIETADIVKRLERLEAEIKGFAP